MSTQRGAALLMALLIMAIAATIASALIGRQQQAIQRIQDLQQLAQLRHAQIAGQRFAQAVLLEELSTDPFIDEVSDFWRTPIPPLPVLDNVILSGCLHDLSGRLNINDLLDAEGEVNAVHKTRFANLLESLDFDPQLVDALIDWIDEDANPLGSAGAEDDIYLLRNPPLRTPNIPMQSLSELRLIEGFHDQDNARLEALWPHIAAVPQGARLNVNLASHEVLLSLAPHMDQVMDDINPWGNTSSSAPGSASSSAAPNPTAAPDTPPPPSDPFVCQLDAQPGAYEYPQDYVGPFQSVGDFIGATTILSQDEEEPDLVIDEDAREDLAMVSDYFLLTLDISVGDQIRRQYSVLQRQSDEVRILWQADLAW